MHVSVHAGRRWARAPHESAGTGACERDPGGTAWHGTLPGTTGRWHHEPCTSAFPFMPVLLSLEVAAS